MHWADEDHYREEMVTAWIAGSEAIADAVIAQWVMEAAQRKPKGRPRPSAPEPEEAQLAVTYAAAAELLGGMSVDHFERHVLPDVRVVVGIGRKRLLPRAEIVRWLEVHSARALRGN